MEDYSKGAVGFAIGSGIFLVIVCIAGAYIHHRGGLLKILRAERERRDADRQARDIELAHAADEADRTAVREYKRMMADKKAQEAVKEAQETINAVTISNGLVGSMAMPPERVELNENWPEDDKQSEEKMYTKHTKKLDVKKGKVVGNDSSNLSVEPAVDPMSFTMVSGKHMAALYRQE